jgi:hypothetical protein
MADSEKRVLVATDCLSEGVNLQGSFDAVLHYDLPWNPNRLEQRDGRVDRFGQPKKEIRSVVLFSPDNPIDRVVLQVLIRKVREIYSSLGIRVSFASDTESVAQALVESILQGKSKDASQLGFEFLESDTAKQFTLGLELDAKREEESRTRFAQYSIHPDEVSKEIEATDTVLGDPNAVRNFVLNAAQRLGLNVSSKGKYYLLDVGQLPEELRQKLGWQKPIKMVFDSPAPQDVENAVVIGRNHLLTVHLSEKITGMAFRPKASEDNFRCGAAYTSATKSRTVILMLRVRYILSRRGQQDQFAEEVVTTGYKAESTNLSWYPANDPSLLALLESAEVTGNITKNEKQQRLERALEEVGTSKAELQRIADSRGDELEAAQSQGFNAIVLSPFVASIGLTITEANHVIHYGRWWNPAVEAQATDRVYRIGQEKPVFVYLPILRDSTKRLKKSFDEGLHELIAEKQHHAQEFLTPLPEEDRLGEELFGRMRGQNPPTNPGEPLTSEMVDSLPAHLFESLVACLLENEGYQTVLTVRSNEHGADVLGFSKGDVWIIQVKHTKRDQMIGSVAMSDLMAARMSYSMPLSYPVRLLAVTNSNFSSETQKEASQHGITLLDRRELMTRLRTASLTMGRIYTRETDRCKSFDEGIKAARHWFDG